MSVRPSGAQADAPASRSKGRPAVIYVMGAGRSGSTILGIALGNCTDVFFAGELARWHRRAGAPVAGEERQRFWRAVREELDVGEDRLGPEVRCLQQSSAVFSIRSWPAQRRLGPRYRRVSESLYRAVARTAGAKYIVDTSHFPRRARQLQAVDGIDLYLVFLVRDPQSVVAAYGRRDVVQGPEFGTLATNSYLWLTYALSLFVFLRHPRARRLLVRHEAFLADPAGVLREILDLVGSPAEIPNLNALESGLAFLGNRIATSDVLAIKSQPEQPSRGSLVTALLQLPWRVVFYLLGRTAR
jgi:hypothetical protein